VLWLLLPGMPRVTLHDKCAVTSLEQDAAGKDIGPLGWSVLAARLVPWRHLQAPEIRQ